MRPEQDQSSPFPDVVEYRVIEYAPGRFAPVVARGGEWRFTGGRSFGSPEAAAAAANDEVGFLKRFWLDKARSDRTNEAVVAGVYYRIGTKTSEVRPEFRGHAGRTFHLKSLSAGEVTTTVDLWHGGQIPDFARPSFPDTHEFTSGGDA